MSSVNSIQRQRGVLTIFISMIMLLLITVLVTAAYRLSTNNLRAVGNVQARDGAIAASNMLIEQTIGSEFWLLSDVTDNPVDLNQDGVFEYLVRLQVPRCIRATPAASTTYSSVTLPGMSSASSWNTVWELDTTTTDTVTGTEVRVVQGVRVLLSPAFKNTYCT
jgi:hypothetical protein